MTKKVIIVLLIICCMISSCKDKVKTTITGWWSIDTLVYGNSDIKYCLLNNGIFFHENDVKLPITDNSCIELFFANDEKGDWHVMHSDSIPLLLKIDTKNVIFKGVHRIVFRRDEINKLLKMEIKSDSLYVVCRKGMFCYDCNQELINDLVRRSIR